MSAYTVRAVAVALLFIVAPLLAIAVHAVVAGDGAAVAVVVGLLLVTGAGGWWVARPRRRSG